MLRIKIVGGAIIVGAALAAGGSAHAAPTDDNIVTFEILGGTLDILGAPTADLGTGAPGAAFTGVLGPVTVTDGRAFPDASWDATVTSTDFITGAATPSQTIVATDATYLSGPVTASTGNGTLTPGQPTTPADLSSTADLPAMSHVGGTGNNTATWGPTLSVQSALANEAGIYTGTVTHSVA